MVSPGVTPKGLEKTRSHGRTYIRQIADRHSLSATISRVTSAGEPSEENWPTASLERVCEGARRGISQTKERGGSAAAMLESIGASNLSSSVR